MSNSLSPDRPAGPLRVCLVNEFFWPDDAGGTGTVLSELAAALRARYGADVELDVVTSRNRYRRAAGQDESPLAEREDWNGVRIRRVASPSAVGKRALPRLAANTRFGAAALRAMLEEHRRRPYDLVVVGTAPPTLAAVAAMFRRLTGTPYLYIIYDLDPDRAVLLGVLREGGVAARALRSCQRGWLHGAARVVVLGRCMREHLGAAYGLPADKVAVIPIGSDPDEITPLAREDSAFRREHGLQDDFVVLYSGNFGRYHNFDAILDAAKQLGASAPRVRFVLVGGGAQRERIERRVAGEGIANVLLLPFVSRRDFPDMLAAADASLVTLEPGMEGLCVPSKFYSLLASGRPVIALMGERCEVARVLAEEGCGVRADAGDAGALAGAVLAMLSDQGRARSMGDRARAALEARFSCGEVAARYFETMHAAAGTTAPPARAAVPTPSNETAVGATAVANAAPRKNMESVTS